MNIVDNHHNLSTIKKNPVNHYNQTISSLQTNRSCISSVHVTLLTVQKPTPLPTNEYYELITEIYVLCFGSQSKHVYLYSTILSEVEVLCLKGIRNKIPITYTLPVQTYTYYQRHTANSKLHYNGNENKYIYISFSFITFTE